MKDSSIAAMRREEKRKEKSGNKAAQPTKLTIKLKRGAEVFDVCYLRDRKYQICSTAHEGTRIHSASYPYTYKPKIATM